MPHLNEVIKRKELFKKLNNISCLFKLDILKFHDKRISPTFSDFHFLEKKYISSLDNRRYRNEISQSCKNVKYYYIKKRKLTKFNKRKKKKTFRINSGKYLFSDKVNINKLNEELKNIEKIIKEKNIITNKKKELSLADFKYPSQKFYKANKEEINLLKKSETQYYLPIECENSTIIRLINIKNKISSPIFRCVRNSKFGLRKKERKFFFFYSSFICSFFFLMGIWQYNKMEKKKFLINYILHNLNKSIIIINDSHFPWSDDFLILKKNYENLSKNLLHYESSSGLISSTNLSKIKFLILSFYENVKSLSEKVFMQKLFLYSNLKNNQVKNEKTISEIYDSKKNEIKGQEENKEINEKKLYVDIENIHNIYEWIIRIRNENLLMKLYRKVVKKCITEDELKKLVIEKYKYRKVQLTGVLDTTNEFYVGPKLYENKKDKMYYYVICPLFLKNGKCILVNRGLISEDILEEKKNEIPKIVTIRAILDPGELYECSFKKLKNFSNKNKYSNYFFYYDTQEICHYANISDFEGSSYFIANIYDIIVHEDYSSDIKSDYYSNFNNSDTKELDSHLKNLNDININDMDRESQERINRLLKYNDNIQNFKNSQFQNIKPFRYDEHFIHKKKKDYFNFYADENTHFSYACQWFLFSFIFSTISIFKFVQFKRWVF
ncbi:conserved Plasmodium protein, unknown function [Plasmodium gallinaceum]|uniref:SURF1-like protein n=1 Tax=Plasmodium gallinaceum TaxID=5849 RepID=A0A1J1GZX4_PLAGA|nr:conserved Plasmodium protein, unknown function [Plasmodium gallinaceum]CRG96572.1 conserved Plasmodium protein, unknown function [Plasmodium gallinaceum]